MMGCLTAPFRVLGCLGLLAVLVGGWLYRDRVLRQVNDLRDRVVHPASARTGPTGIVRGRPGPRSLASAHAKIDSLNGWRADSIVLSPAEVASLMGEGLAPKFRKELDSLQVELLDGEVKVGARLRTARLPREVVGPFAGALRPNEPVEAIGPLRVTAPGAGEWVVRSFSIRGIPVPAAAVKRMVAGALDDPARETIPWRVPKGISGVRVRTGGVTLYGAPKS
jgi:hypothetical protein